MQRLILFLQKRFTHPEHFYQYPYHTGMVYPRQPKNPRLNLILFLATIMSTLLVGAMMEGADILSHPVQLVRGVPFSFSLLLILGVHEFGHYFYARKWGVDVTLPYFIPAPTIIGTMGAIIKMRGPIPNRNAVLEIGAAGPLAGFAVALPVTLIGLKLSSVQAVAAAGEGMLSMGDPLIFKLFSGWIFGPIPEGYDVFLHPMAFSGWIGMLVTMLNLLPIGQLDGGHIAFAVFGRSFRYVTWVFLGIMFVLGRQWPGWWFWMILISLLVGHRHPPPVDTYSPLSAGHRLAAWITLAVFILTFMPVPFAL